MTTLSPDPLLEREVLADRLAGLVNRQAKLRILQARIPGDLARTEAAIRELEVRIGVRRRPSNGRPPSSMRDRILEVLPATRAQIVERTGLQDGQVGNYLQRMAVAGQVIRPTRRGGDWCVARE